MLFVDLLILASCQMIIHLCQAFLHLILLTNYKILVIISSLAHFTDSAPFSLYNGIYQSAYFALPLVLLKPRGLLLVPHYTSASLMIQVLLLLLLGLFFLLFIDACRHLAWLFGQER